MDNQIIKSESQITTSVSAFDYKKDIALLTPEERQYYLTLAKDINISQVNTIHTFGSQISECVSRDADVLLEHSKANRTSDITELINNLLGELENIKEANEPESGFKGFLKKLPIVGGLVKSIEKSEIRNNTIKENIDTISKQLTACRVSTMSDNQTLMTMRENTVNYLEETRKMIIALGIVKEELDKELAEIESNPDVDVNEITQKQAAQNALSKRVTDMVSAETIFESNLYQIAMIAGNNATLAQQIEHTISNVVPLIKQGLSIDILVSRQEQAEQMNSRVKTVANELIKQNAQKLKTSSIKIAKSAEEPFMEAKSINETMDAIISTITEVKSIHENGENMRQQYLLDMQKLSKDLETAVRTPILENKTNNTTKSIASF